MGGPEENGNEIEGRRRKKMEGMVGGEKMEWGSGKKDGEGERDGRGGGGKKGKYHRRGKPKKRGEGGGGRSIREEIASGNEKSGKEIGKVDRRGEEGK